MPLSREISEPLGRNPSAEVLQWTGSLRSPPKQKSLTYSNPSPSRSRARSRSSLGASTSSLRRSGSFGNLRKSTGSLAASFNNTAGTSANLGNIETEYIKNLQQQVYFLELEANYLRDQARKATDMHPTMTAEAERMLAKLRQLQTQVDGLHLEVQRKESNLSTMNTEKMRIMDRLKDEEESHLREKRLLMEEIVDLKKGKDETERDNSRKEIQIGHAREEMDKSCLALKNAEHKIQILRTQLDQRIDQHKMTQLTLEEKRSELLSTTSTLREVEDKYYSSTATLNDKVLQDLRDEIRMLRQKLKETEMNAEQDRFLRNKISDDSSHLVKENALLNQQVLEYQKQLDREKELRESMDTRRASSITELVTTKEKEKHLQMELDHSNKLLQQERERVRHYMDQLAKQETINTSIDLSASTTQSRLSELQGIHSHTDSENSQLRRDKQLLVDHVADLQKQLADKEKEVIRLESHIHTLEAELGQVEREKRMETELQSGKWEEFERLADSMRSISRTMARSSSPLASSRSRLLES